MSLSIGSRKAFAMRTIEMKSTLNHHIVPRFSHLSALPERERRRAGIDIRDPENKVEKMRLSAFN